MRKQETDFRPADNTLVVATHGRGSFQTVITEPISVGQISSEVPSSYSLKQNYPNPFNSSSNLKFEIANFGDVKLVVYDILGKTVQTLVNERLQPGTYEVRFDGSMLNSGVYFYRLKSGNYTETKRMLMIK